MMERIHDRGVGDEHPFPMSDPWQDFEGVIDRIIALTQIDNHRGTFQDRSCNSDQQFDARTTSETALLKFGLAQ